MKDHPILKKAFEYEIIGFNFQKGLSNKTESYIDITLQKENEVKRLRFLSPIKIKIEGFPMTWGFCISDVSNRFSDYKVEVSDFEADKIYFRARKVVDLDKVTEIELEILNVEFEYNLDS